MPGIGSIKSLLASLTLRNDRFVIRIAALTYFPAVCPIVSWSKVLTPWTGVLVPFAWVRCTWVPSWSRAASCCSLWDLSNINGEALNAPTKFGHETQIPVFI